MNSEIINIHFVVRSVDRTITAQYNKFYHFPYNGIEYVQSRYLPTSIQTYSALGITNVQPLNFTNL